VLVVAVAVVLVDMLAQVVEAVVMLPLLVLVRVELAAAEQRVLAAMSGYVVAVEEASACLVKAPMALLEL
jgi:hypothetical protein